MTVKQMVKTISKIKKWCWSPILLNDSEGLIYIINVQGTAWVELTKSGKIDIMLVTVLVYIVAETLT